MAKSSYREYLSWRVLAAAVMLGLVIGACGFGVDHLFHKATRLLASDFYTSIVAVMLVYVLLVYEKRRRVILARRMEIAAEVNHHIRNALTAVVFSASVQNDPKLEAVLRDATARIDWVLNTVLPDGETELKWPVQSNGWKPAAWDESKAEAMIKADEQ